MYHSHLLINVGDNPDRPDWNLCRRWLRNLYRVHQRLSMAFPSRPLEEGEREAAYCKPFNPSDFPLLRNLPTEAEGTDVHQPRTKNGGFLFRIDYPVDPQQGGRRPVIIVQSPTEPDWYYAFGLNKSAADDRKPPIGNAGFLLAAPPQPKPVTIELDDDALVLSSPESKPPQTHCLRSGDLVRFRLRANPTRKTQDGSKNGKRKRINPSPEDHVKWLESKFGEAAASRIFLETFVPGWAYGWRTKYEPHAEQSESQKGQPMQWWSVLFEGVFDLGDPAALKQLLESGIGSAKAFGFGLLSVAPG